ncbi:MAG: T9SS type A sorting domain-containing protein [Candidatus Eisenbacteria bacterium]
MQRNVIQKYEEAPTPTITMTFTGTSALPACFATTGSYTFSFTVTNPPIGGWVDFYYDTASTFDASTAKLCIESGTVAPTSTSAVWSFADTPGGVPADNDSYYLYARVKDASGNTVATDATTSSELFCMDSTLLPTLKATDQIDGDRTLSLQNNLSRVISLSVSYPDSIVACGFKGTFDPTIIEVVGITQGNAWDNTGATNVIFTTNYNNTAGTFEVNSSGVGTPFGLTGNGPYVVANVEVKAKADAVTTDARTKNGTFAVVKASSSLTDYLGATPDPWKTQSVSLRAGYLGDLATTSSGADSTLPHLQPKPDGFINFADQMVFTLGWNGDGTVQDPIADLGPATGSAPDLVSAPDGVYDVEDILAFTTMYSWAASNGFLRTVPGASEFAVHRVLGPRPASLGADVSGQARAYTVSRVQNPLPGSTIDVDLVADAENLTGALLTLGYDSSQLEPIAVHAGSHLKGNDGNLFFQRGGDGWIEIASSRLDRSKPAVSGVGTVATVTFRLLGSTTSDFDLHYDLRSAGDRVLGRGIAQTGALSGAPATFALFPNYPNPVSGATNIVFSLPAQSGVALDLYDASGRLVKNLAKGSYESGYHVVSFDGRNTSGDPLAAGVYFYQLRANDQVSTRKLIVTR